MQEKLDILSLDDIKRMEKDSLEYCKEQLYEDKYNTDNIDLKELKNIVDKSIIEKHEYLNEDIYHTQHGIRHHLRTQIYSYILLKNLNYDFNTINIMNYICSIHDTQRKNDYKDHEHGLLAYEKFVENSNYDKFKLKQVLEKHDEKIFETENLLLMILKCSDALDRFRLKNLKGWITMDRIPVSNNNELMNIRNETKKMIMLCRKFTLLTEKYRLENKEEDDYNVIMDNLYELKRRDINERNFK